MEGTVFNPETQEGVWFSFFTSTVDPSTGEVKYDDPKPGAAEFRIRSTKKFYEERLSSRKRESSMVLNPKSRSMERVAYLKEQTIEETMAERDDAWDYAITGIKKAFWPDGTPIQCNRADKLKLRNLSIVDRFVAKCFLTLDEQEVQEAAVKSKNLQTSQSGDSA